MLAPTKLNSKLSGMSLFASSGLSNGCEPPKTGVQGDNFVNESGETLKAFCIDGTLNMESNSLKNEPRDVGLWLLLLAVEISPLEPRDVEPNDIAFGRTRSESSGSELLKFDKEQNADELLGDVGDEESEKNDDEL